jgi:hypothetical protein
MSDHRKFAYYYDYFLLSVWSVIEDLPEIFTKITNNESVSVFDKSPRCTWDYSAWMVHSPETGNLSSITDSFDSLDKIPSGSLWDVIISVDPQIDSKKTETLLKLSKHLSSDGIVIAMFNSLSAIKALYEKGDIAAYLHPSSVLRIPPMDDDSCWPSDIRYCYLVCFSQRSPYNLTNFVDWTGDPNGSDGNLNSFVVAHKPSKNLFTDFGQLQEYLKSRDMNSYLNAVDESKPMEFAALILRQHNRLGFKEHLFRFEGFEIQATLHSLSLIDSDFKAFNHVPILTLASEIRMTRNSFDDSENSVYIPLLKGNQKVTQYQKEINIKHQNMCQIIVKKEIILIDYLVAYLNSFWGKSFYDSLVLEKNGVIKKLAKSDVGKLMIALPTLDQQKVIYLSTSQIDNVIFDLKSLQKAIMINPISAKNEKDKIDSIQATIKSVSPLLKEESKTHEFKASLRTPYPDLIPELEGGRQIFRHGKKKFTSIKEVQNTLQDIILKTICSFINTDGGTLVIGVHERSNVKEVIGIEREGFKSSDEYERHVNQLLINEFGDLIVSKYVHTKIESLAGKKICQIDCKIKDEMPLFFRDKCFVRSGPRVSELSMLELAQLVAERNIKVPQ